MLKKSFGRTQKYTTVQEYIDQIPAAARPVFDQLLRARPKIVAGRRSFELRHYQLQIDQNGPACSFLAGKIIWAYQF